MKTLAFFFALILPVSARIGETVEECRTRYGKEIDVSEKNSGMIFSKADFTVAIVFDEGRAAMISLTHSTGKSILGTPPEITEAERTTLMLSNGGDSDWVERKNIEFGAKTWDTKDGTRTARYDTLKHSLTICTQAFIRKSAQKKAAEEKQNLKGF